MKRLSILIMIFLLAANILIPLTMAQDSATNNILFEKKPFDKSHVIIDKKSDGSGKVTYTIEIENLLEPSNGFEPHDVSVYYSVNDNVYICYNEIKTEFIPLTIQETVKNYEIYAPDENAICKGQVIEGLIGGLIPLIGLAQYASETSECMPKYSWWCKSLIQYEAPDQITENSNSIPDPEILKAIEGNSEEERNGRRINNVLFTATALGGSTGNDRVKAVRFTIPLKIKDLAEISSLRIWINCLDPLGSKMGIYLDDPQINKFKSTIDSAENGAKVLEKSGQITSVTWPTKDRYDHNEPIPVDVSIENTGSEARFYWVGYSVQDSTGNWWDAPAQQAAVIQPGENGSIELKWLPPNEAPDGVYNATVALWDARNSTTELMEGEFDRMTKPNAFQLSRIQKNPSNVLSNVIGGWNKTFGESGVYEVKSVRQTSDGGYIPHSALSVHPVIIFAFLP